MKTLELKNKDEVRYLKQGLMLWTDKMMLDSMKPAYVEFVERVVDLCYSYSPTDTTDQIAEQADRISIKKWYEIARKNDERHHK